MCNSISSTVSVTEKNYAVIFILREDECDLIVKLYRDYIRNEILTTNFIAALNDEFHRNSMEIYGNKACLCTDTILRFNL
jgi:hypothetical protein